MLAERCWRDGAAAAPRSARALGEVAAALEAAGAGCALGARTRDGAVCMDLALEVDGHGVALEVNGPGMYSSNEPRRLLGDAGARARLLRARGWGVVSVALHEWEALPADAAARAAALLRAVDEELGHAQWASFGPPADAAPEAIAAARDAAAAAQAAALHEALLRQMVLQQQDQQAAVVQAQQQAALALAAQQQQEAEQHGMDIATAELVQLLLRQQQQQSFAQQQQQQAAAMQYMNPIRRISAEAGDVAAAAAAAVLAERASASSWLQSQLAAATFSNPSTPLGSQQQQQAHAGLAALLHGASGGGGGGEYSSSRGSEPLPPAMAGMPVMSVPDADSGIWSWGSNVEAAAAAAASMRRPLVSRPDDLMLGFGWGGGIWGRP